MSTKVRTREVFRTRLGFLLIAAGCAVGIGNVWRFPYIVGQYGGAYFVLLYLFFLLSVGIPLLTVELAIGRASRSSMAYCYERLEQPGSHWHFNKWWQFSGNYILMAFYVVVAGWMLFYFCNFVSGNITPGMTRETAGQNFGELLANPETMFLCVFITVLFSFTIVALGVIKGVERFTKPLMIVLILLLFFMACRSATLDGFEEGIKFYLKPDFEKFENNIGEAIWAAMGQAFFTLSVGFGAIAIFGSYMSERHKILNEAVFIATFDTIIALLSGFVIFPACFTYGINPDAGPNLLFITMTVVFSNMTLGTIWGSLFFLFMLIAAVSTMIAVFESSIAGCIELFKWTRIKAVVINFVVIIALSLLPMLGFNVLSDVHIIGSNTGILDFFDFLVSNNILPIGSIVFVLFICSKSGMQWKNYIDQCNVGKGFSMPTALYFYYKYILTTMVIIVLAVGYYKIFGRA
ncbi:neurotransmitter:Na+ symporter, NSS family [Succinivibrio dextrinosolvens]|uniref:sodium-dependent transporter n=1 Tax=Succinivibrio dextrinosolvens TaxID=83771 RepID=UPI0008F27802|nr:sodium-dependent transporter [Succinivibrio dextrinosolvens]SFS35753.1 neurotransmitter:Na+ symporter, NSS family [Succinivibrio dextrinosolvens]